MSWLELGEGVRWILKRKEEGGGGKKEEEKVW